MGCCIILNFQTIELINTALLTGKSQSYPLRIFSISYSGQIQDITTQTTCHSGDETVLKVYNVYYYYYYPIDNSGISL